MDNRLRKLEIKKLIQEYQHLDTDFDYKQEVISEYKTFFLEKAGNLKKEMFPEMFKEQPIVETKEDNQDNQKTSDSDKEENNDTNNENQENTETIKKSEIDENLIDPSVKSKVKRMYREIVKITHPDKTNSTKYIELYHRATISSDNYNLIDLFLICNELDISIELEPEDKEVLVVLIDGKKKKTKQIESSFIWLWINAKTDLEKDNIIKVFVTQTTKK